MDMHQGFDTLYTDLVESRIVGDSLAPLLRSVPIYGSHGNTISNTFDRVQYVPLLRRQFGSIKIDKKDGLGRPVIRTGKTRSNASRRTLQIETVLMARAGSDVYEVYITRQVGGNLPFFVGARVQQVHGLGNLFENLFRRAMALIKRGAVALGKRALNTGVRVVQDVVAGHSLKQAVKQREKEAGPIFRTAC
ncbi:MAG: hypothetical protein M3H12_01505 [Chromatiales bacterium]